MTWQSEHYTVGWICAIDIEYTVACELLDEEYTTDKTPKIDISQDPNIYTFGSIHGHAIVVACLPRGRYGINSAAVVAERMRRSFPAIRFGLMVGIAGGAPSDKHDIRLGDIVVSSPTPRNGGVIQYDYGKAVQHQEFEETGHLASPPEVLLNALSHLAMQHTRKGHTIKEIITAMIEKNPRMEKYAPPKQHPDRLCVSSYIHKDQGLCECQGSDVTSMGSKDSMHSNFVPRLPRAKDLDDPTIHYGLIASANQLMKNASVRDALSCKHEVLCFETEAAGLMNSFPCVVIRGICDYSDTHKNDLWQSYAAASAAAYAKELLSIVPAKVFGNTVIEPSSEHENWEGWASDLMSRLSNPSLITLSEPQRSKISRRDSHPYENQPKFSPPARTLSYGKHKCKICDEVFIYLSSLKTHMDSHVDKRPFTHKASDYSRQLSDSPVSVHRETTFQKDPYNVFDASRGHDFSMTQMTGSSTVLDERLKSPSELHTQASTGHTAQKPPVLGNLSPSFQMKHGFPHLPPLSQLNDSNDSRFQRHYYGIPPPSIIRTSTETIEYNRNGSISKRTFSQTSSHSSHNSMNETRKYSWSDPESSQTRRSLEPTIDSRIHTQSEVETLLDSLIEENTTDHTSPSQLFTQEYETSLQKDESHHEPERSIASNPAENSMSYESAISEDFQILEHIFNASDLGSMEQTRLQFHDTLRRLRTRVDALLDANANGEPQQQFYVEQPIEDQRENNYECLFCHEQFESKNEMERHQLVHLGDRSFSTRYDYFRTYGHFPD